MTATTENRASPAPRRKWLRVAIMAALLSAAWLLWSGLYKPLLLSLGAFSVALTLFLIDRKGYFTDNAFAFRYSVSLLGFWAWLGKEIVLSSLEVAKVVLSRRLAVKPSTVVIDVGHMDELDQAVLGNSITLTPGTLTLDVYENRMLVHALNEDIAAGLREGEMQRRVEDLRDN